MKCVFCEVVSGKENATIIAEDQSCLAIVPKDVEVDNHLLILSKSHAESLLDVSPEILSDTSFFVQKVCKALSEEYGYTGFNVLHASGSNAGQSVSHFHLHIIPRRNGDNIDAWPIFQGGKSNLSKLRLST